MEIDIYKSAIDGEKYLSVPAGTDIINTPFPSTLDPDLVKLSPFKTSLDIQPGEKRWAIDGGDLLRQIEEKGFATHTAKVIVIRAATLPQPS